MSLLFQGAENLAKGSVKTVEGVSGIFEGIFGVASTGFKSAKNVLHKIVGGKKHRIKKLRKKSPKKSPKKRKRRSK